MSVTFAASPRLSRPPHQRGTTLTDSYYKHGEDIANRLHMNEAFPAFRKRYLTMPRSGSTITYNDIDNVTWNVLKKIPPEITTKAKSLVQEAILKKKIFMIYGPYDKIRQALRRRGWVEKVNDCKLLLGIFSRSLKQYRIDSARKEVGGDHGSNDKPNGENTDENSNVTSPIESPRSNNDNYPKDIPENDDLLHAVASQFVFNCNPDLIWTLRTNQVDTSNMKPNQLLNHYRKAGSFTTKSGLIRSFNHMRWFEKDPDEVHPRSYIVSEEHDKKAFIDDFHLTACMGLVKIATLLKVSDNENEIVETNNSKASRVQPVINYSTKNFGESLMKIDRKYLEMAIHYCQLYHKNLITKNVDKQETVFCSTKRWEEFFKNYLLVTDEGYGIEMSDSLKANCDKMAEDMKSFHFQHNLDGYKNVWIVKPGAKSRGRGIHCISKLSEMIDTLTHIDETLIIQKYIEKPLLIYNTKFDIRQWFVVTSWSPLTIWWYKDCYVRFCSQQFTLNDLNESVHLSNNSIQHKYKNGPRSKYLPANNMWHWQQFEAYLKRMGHETAWETQILPSMKDTIIDILLCTQEEVEDRPNSFELYGADFMITDGDLKTWILEINSSPCMAASTNVTAELTKNVSEDIIKIIVDYPQNPDCDLGRFELLYKQHPFMKPLIERTRDLVIRGSGIRRPFERKKNVNASEHSESVSQQSKSSTIYSDEPSILRQKLKRVVHHSGSLRTDLSLDSNNRPFRKSLSIAPYVNHYQREKQKASNDVLKRFSELNTKREKLNANNYHQNRFNYFSTLTNSKTSSNFTDSTISTEQGETKTAPKEKSLPVLRTLQANPLHNTQVHEKHKKAISDFVVNKAPYYKSLVKKSMEENQTLVLKLNNVYSNKLDIKNPRMNQILNAYLPKN